MSIAAKRAFVHFAHLETAPLEAIKAQGGEYPIVVIPMTTQHYMMLQRNLLYTGITRAKKVVVLVGSVKAIGMAVRNNSVTKRNTGLADKLKIAVES